jgi:NADPH:quinone reductase-like Zn-dependent oxidoreductase
MRAVVYRRYGPPDVLEVSDVPLPEPRAGEVRLRIEAASLNPIDWKLREGHLRLAPGFEAPPRITGIDVAGVIDAVGGGASERHIGERVFGSLSPFRREGSCAEACVIATSRLAAIPDALDFVDAACLPIAAGTAVEGVI